MTREEIVKAITDNKTMPFIQPEQLANIVDFVIKNYQPSLPSNLDEAAHEFEDKAISDYDDIVVTEDGEERPVLKYNFTDAFKAGAEWMAGQGETIEGEVMKDINNNLCVTAKGFSGKEAKFGDKVVVQIRKKQWRKNNG